MWMILKTGIKIVENELKERKIAKRLEYWETIIMSKILFKYVAKIVFRKVWASGIWL